MNKPILMDVNVIKIINKQARKQASREFYGVEFADINMKTTVKDYKERDNEYDSDFEYDDKSYETSNDSTVAGDGYLSDDLIS